MCWIYVSKQDGSLADVGTQQEMRWLTDAICWLHESTRRRYGLYVGDKPNQFKTAVTCEVPGPKFRTWHFPHSVSDGRQG